MFTREDSPPPRVAAAGTSRRERRQPLGHLWGGVGGVNAVVRAQLWIPEGSSALVKGVLEDCWEAHETGEKYDADGRLRTRGRKAIIQEMSDEAYIIYRAKRMGMSLGDCAVLVNDFMRSNGRGDGFWMASRRAADNPGPGGSRRAPQPSSARLPALRAPLQ